MLRSIDLLTRGPHLAQLPMPPQMLVMLPALGGMLRWAATHLPEAQLREIIGSTRDMCDAWLEAAEGQTDGQPDPDGAPRPGDGAGI